MLALLALLATVPASAAPTPGPSDVGRSVLLDRGTWLHAQPVDDAPRWRVQPIEQAPEYATSPAITAQLQDLRDGWARVRIHNHPAPLTHDDRARAPDQVPATWPHCYPQPPAVAQLGLTAWVPVDAILPVVTRPVEVEASDGSRVTVSPGLAATGRNGLYRLTSSHLLVTVRMPDDAVGASYGPRAPVDTTLVAGTADEAWVVQPTWSGSITAHRDVVRLSGRYTPDDPEIVRLSDRCLRVEPATPFRGVPRRDVSELRDASTWPILVPDGVPITRPDGERITTVSEGPMVLWSRTDCAYDDTRGLCCDALPGLEQAGSEDRLCIDADLPIAEVGRSLGDVLGVFGNTLAEQKERASRLRATVGWTEPRVVSGPVRPEAVTAALGEQADLLVTCYERGLSRDPDLEGTLHLRFAVAPDARIRRPRVLGVDGRLNDAATDCVLLRFELTRILEVLGDDASIVELDLVFETEDPATAEALEEG